MLIRPALPSEVETLSELALRSKQQWGYDDDFMERCQDELTVRAEDAIEQRVFVAEDPAGGAISGFSMLSRSDEPDPELAMLFVEPTLMGKGIGAALMRDAMQRVIDRGWSTLRIEADPNAAGFYEHFGAELVGSVASASIPGRELPLYRIDLAKTEK